MNLVKKAIPFLLTLVVPCMFAAQVVHAARTIGSESSPRAEFPGALLSAAERLHSMGPEHPEHETAWSALFYEVNMSQLALNVYQFTDLIDISPGDLLVGAEISEAMQNPKVWTYLPDNWPREFEKPNPSRQSASQAVHCYVANVQTYLDHDERSRSMPPDLRLRVTEKMHEIARGLGFADGRVDPVWITNAQPEAVYRALFLHEPHGSEVDNSHIAEDIWKARLEMPGNIDVIEALKPYILKNPPRRGLAFKIPEISDSVLAFIRNVAHPIAHQYMEWNQPISPASDQFLRVNPYFLSRPAWSMLYEEPPTVVDKAAVLFIDLIRRRPFINGNKRIAIASLIGLLYLSGQQITISPYSLFRLAHWVQENKSMLEFVFTFPVVKHIIANSLRPLKNRLH